MMASSNTIFTTKVRTAFSFLVEKQGYSVNADDENGAVTFASDRLAVKVFREPGSYMIYVEFRCNDTGEEYLLHEILHAVAPEYEPQSQCSGAHEQETSQCLKQLSQLCEVQLRGFLALDDSTLAKIASSAKSMRMQYTLDAQYGAIRDRANEAWERKDWEKARELYEDAKPGLSATEERRLDFLLKKSSNSTAATLDSTEGER
jgi:hypothetical protein